MAGKPDFAQKLLHDLRLRKERVAAAKSLGRQSSQASRVGQGNSGRTAKGTQLITARESVSSRTGNSSKRSSGSSGTLKVNESSNQIVLYGSGQSSRQVRDLSMAIAFAFENSGNLSKIDTSTSNPLVKFFNRFGPRSFDNQKMDMSNFNTHYLSIDQLPNVSSIHISEISKVVQKLNQILRACSNDLNLDRNSMEVGKELLKGAANLEKSLRMLVNLQESSQCMSRSQSKSRIKLLEEDEDKDEQDDNHNIADQWKLDRPRFSFDKSSKKSFVNQGASGRQQLALSYPNGTSEEQNNSRVVPYKRSTNYVQDLSFSAQGKLNNNSSSSKTTHEKARISNVIAKLMGLDEFPQKQDPKPTKIESKAKEGKLEKVSPRNTKLPEHLNREGGKASPLNTDKMSSLTNNVAPARESKLQLKYEKSWDIPDGSTKSSERKQMQKDVKIPAVSSGAVPDHKLVKLTVNKRQSHTSSPNQVSGFQTFEESEWKQTFTEVKESKIVESKGIMPVSNPGMPQKAQKDNMLKPAEKTHDRFEYKVSANAVEKQNGNKDIPSNHQNFQAEQKGQQVQKQNLSARKQEGYQMETMVASKSKRSTSTNLKNKLLRDKPVPYNERLPKPNEKVSMRDPLNRRHQDAAPMTDSLQKRAFNEDTIKEKDQSHYPPQREPPPNINRESSSNQMLMKEKPTKVSATRTKVIPTKVQKSEIPQKIDVLVTRRNATANQLARSRKQPAKFLKDLKQHMHFKKCSSKNVEEQRDCKVKKEKEITSTEVDMITGPAHQQKPLQGEADRDIILDSNVADTYQIQNTTNLNENFDAMALNSGKVSVVLQTVEQPYVHEDQQELKDNERTEYEESTEPHEPSQQEHKQCPAWERQKQLTGPEKELKEILIKSQLFLSSADALFKLNIPVSFLHAGDYDNAVGKKKLVLDSAYEVMKRKARRYKVSFHPYIQTSISYANVRSLNNLVKQLCQDLEMLKFYGGKGNDECDVVVRLHTMLNNDIYDKNPDVNSMWDLEWSNLPSMLPEKDDAVRDIEKHMLNGLFDEIANDLLLVNVVV